MNLLINFRESAEIGNFAEITSRELGFLSNVAVLVAFSFHFIFIFLFIQTG